MIDPLDLMPDPNEDPELYRMLDARRRLILALGWVHPEWTRNLITRKLKLLDAKIALHRMPDTTHA